MHLQIKYRPRAYQEVLHNSEKRRKVLVRHRGSGKTTACLGELVKRACLKKGTYEFISPTYKQSKRNAWPIIKEMLEGWPKTAFNESELKVSLMNGSVIYFLGSDDPDSLRGLDYHGVIFDEYSQQPGNIFGEIVRPRLSITDGRAIWIGTPKGYNSFYDLYDNAKKDDDWMADLKTVDDTGIISDDELSQARKEMTNDEYEQEFMCNFNSAIKGAYYAKELSDCRISGRISRGLYNRDKPVYTAWDLGVSDYTTIVFFQLDGRVLSVIDSYEKNGEPLDHYVHILSDKMYRYGKHFFPHDARQREKQSGISTIEFMGEMLGHDKCDIVGNHRVEDGIRKSRLIFDKIRFDEDNTKDLINAIGQYTQEWDDKKGMFRDRPLHNWASHYADAFRYMCMSYDSVVMENAPRMEREHIPVVSKITGKVMNQESVRDRMLRMKNINKY